MAGVCHGPVDELYCDDLSRVARFENGDCGGIAL